MADASKLEQLLECLIHVIGRAAIPENQVAQIVGTSPRQVRAFNLCDGRNSQKEISQKAGLDQGNLSRTFLRLPKAGVAFRIGDNQDARLLHIYPIRSQPKTRKRKRASKKPRRREGR